MSAISLAVANGRYSNIRCIGEGSFCRVFRGIRDKDRSIVAVKEINARFLGATLPEIEDYRRMVKKEFDIMAASRHPNILQMLDCYSEGDYLHVEMEFCDWETLKTAIERRQGDAHPESQVWLFTGQLALALQHLHDTCKVLHRDVQVGNIFVVYGGLLKLGDFGVVGKRLGRLTSTMANPPPEILNGDCFSTKSEIWTLGIVVHNIATLDLKYTGPDQSNTMCTDCYSDELRALTYHMLLNPEPANRPSASEILQQPKIQASFCDFMANIAFATVQQNVPREIVEIVQQPILSNFPRNYFANFPRAPKDLLRNAQSGIEAIVVIPNPQRPGDVPMLLLVCHNGDILAMSSCDWATVEWQCHVKVPAGQFEETELSHAVYDDVTGQLYFSNGNRGTIYQIALSNLMANAKKTVELDILIDPKQSEGRCFEGLAIDCANRHLYCCNWEEYGKSNNGITIWQLPTYKTPQPQQAQLVAVIKTGYKPRFCAFFYERPSELLYLAISDQSNDRIDLLSADWPRYCHEIANNRKLERGSKIAVATFDVAETSPCSLILRRIGFIAQFDYNDKRKLGSVSVPCQVAFDQVGNLFVAEDGPKRVQAFSFVGEDDQMAVLYPNVPNRQTGPRAMAAAWVSGQVGRNFTRLAVAANCPSRQLQSPCLITHGNCGYGSTGIAIFGQ